MGVLIYMVVCVTNGKRYFGITKGTLKRRKQRHESSSLHGSTCKFHSALRKYGVANFAWHELDQVETRLEACEAEKFLIREFDTTGSKNGYNTTSGGDGGVHRMSPTDEVRRRTSSTLKRWHASGDPEAASLRSKISTVRKSTPTSVETREKMSVAHLGQIRSQESRARISSSKRRYSDGTVKAVTAEAGRSGLHAASRQFGIPRKTIARWMWPAEKLEDDKRTMREREFKRCRQTRLNNPLVPAPM